MALEEDRDLEGQPCWSLRVTAPNGTTHRLLIDKSTMLLEAIEVEPSAEALGASIPRKGRSRSSVPGGKPGTP